MADLEKDIKDGILGLGNIPAKRDPDAETYEERDDIMALYAPVALLTLPARWLVVLVGHMAIGKGRLGAGPSMLSGN